MSYSPDDGQVDPQYWESIISQLSLATPEDLINRILLAWTHRPLQDYVYVQKAPKDWLFELFEIANKKAWLSPLLNRVHRWTQHPGVREAIKQAIGDYILVRPAWYDVPIASGRITIDRSNFRSALYDFLEKESDNLRLLSIRGGNPGKSHCRWLAQHVAKQIGITPIHIDLLQEGSQIRSCLANRLSLNTTDFQERYTTVTKNINEFLSWVTGQLAKPPSSSAKFLLIFDNLEKTGVPGEARDLVIALTRRAVNQDLQNVWIILIGAESLEEDLQHPGATIEEVVPPVTNDEVNQFVQFAWKYKGGAGPGPQHIPPALADMITGSPIPLSKDKLRIADRELSQWMLNIP